LIGKNVPRVDAPAKIAGTAKFAIDVSLPNMLTAVIARPPRFGARLKSVDDKPAKAIAGVVDIVSWPAGVAVLGRGFWAAKTGRDALKIEWDETAAETQGTADIAAEYRKLLERPGHVARRDGNADAAIAGAARTFVAEYQFPYLAHASMAPLNCLVELAADRCQVWSGSQMQTLDQGISAKITGLNPEQVEIHTMFAGGSFGRRAVQTVVAEAVSIAKVIGGRAPVRVIWTREDDIRGGFYRRFSFIACARASIKPGRSPAGIITSSANRCRRWRLKRPPSIHRSCRAPCRCPTQSPM
jgi:isoquinoline 1-oxidoreductase subunit beta